MKKYILLALVIMMLSLSLVFPFGAFAGEAVSFGKIEYKQEPAFSTAFSGEQFKKGSMNSEMYEAIKAFFEKVAKGEVSSAKLTIPESNLPEGLTWTESQLGVKIIENENISDAAMQAFEKKLEEQFDLSKVMLSVLCDCPYEQFWYDKSKGVSFQYGISATSDTLSVSSFEFTFNVSVDYQDGNSSSIDKAKITTGIAPINGPINGIISIMG